MAPRRVNSRRSSFPLGPLLVVAGALLVASAAGMEMAPEIRAWLAGETRWPQGVMLDALVAGSAALLAAAVLMTRRSVERTAAAEEALRESEERLRLVANNVPALISYLDREQRFRFSNRTYDDWLGIPQSGMLGRSIAEVFGEEAYARMRPHLERVLAGEEVQFEFSAAAGGRQRAL
ncbi:MAG TPA: PAS domain-containing protein, partial [Burkholderiales bacterium]